MTIVHRSALIESLHRQYKPIVKMLPARPNRKLKVPNNQNQLNATALPIRNELSQSASADVCRLSQTTLAGTTAKVKVAISFVTVKPEKRCSSKTISQWPLAFGKKGELNL
jgi:hypothetical protein